MSDATGDLELFNAWVEPGGAEVGARPFVAATAARRRLVAFEKQRLGVRLAERSAGRVRLAASAGIQKTISFSAVRMSSPTSAV